eukprot:TRINITY_DN5321_c0_g1_i1.p1 TRINITY_DN5321_c0_g1~~TRINITY_DN5321_c0_g1_i1.p1  ORF type:complete len:114 (+),score=19.06 TRINITY_DN5321_c0_g1_i1:179-520(+)
MDDCRTEDAQRMDEIIRMLVRMRKETKSPSKPTPQAQPKTKTKAQIHTHSVTQAQRRSQASPAPINHQLSHGYVRHALPPTGRPTVHVAVRRSSQVVTPRRQLVRVNSIVDSS